MSSSISPVRRKTLRACIPLFLPEKLLKAVPFGSEHVFCAGPRGAYTDAARATGDALVGSRKPHPPDFPSVPRPRYLTLRLALHHAIVLLPRDVHRRRCACLHRSIIPRAQAQSVSKLTGRTATVRQP